MIKLQDFALKYGVTDRQVQRLLKKYEDEMQTHFERKGANGTWIDETGEKILRSKMRQAPVVLHDSEIGKKISLLEEEIDRLRAKLEYKQDYIEALQVQIIELTGENSRLGTQLKLLPTVEERDALLDENRLLRVQLAAERSKTLWQRLRGQ